MKKNQKKSFKMSKILIKNYEKIVENWPKIGKKILEKFENTGEN